MMNVGNPELAFDFAQLPNAGVGLARLEFVINNTIGIHPKAILEIDRQVPASAARGNQAPCARLCESRSVLCRQAGRRRGHHRCRVLAQAGHRAPVRLQVERIPKLLGGDIYEPEEENPMLGFRGASRYIAHAFRDCFELECRAMKARTRRTGPDQRRADGAVRAQRGRRRPWS
jgi:pyruvate,water dikinase